MRKGVLTLLVGLMLSLGGGITNAQTISSEKESSKHNVEIFCKREKLLHFSKYSSPSFPKEIFPKQLNVQISQFSKNQQSLSFSLTNEEKSKILKQPLSKVRNKSLLSIELKKLNFEQNLDGLFSTEIKVETWQGDATVSAAYKCEATAEWIELALLAFKSDGSVVQSDKGSTAG